MLDRMLLSCRLASHMIVAGFVTFCLFGPASAQGDLAGKNMLGGRIGPWFAEGLTAEVETEEVYVNTSSTAFHLEFFYTYNLTGPLYLDFNLGAVSRGDISIEYKGLTAFGTAGVYPLGIGLRLFPLAAKKNQMVHPFISAGGSLVIGTETLRHVADDYLRTYLGYTTESREALGWYAGVGVDLILGENFALTFLGKYQHAKFGKELVGVKDFSGGQILIGAAYLYE